MHGRGLYCGQRMVAFGVPAWRKFIAAAVDMLSTAQTPRLRVQAHPGGEPPASWRCVQAASCKLEVTASRSCLLLPIFSGALP